MSDTLGRKLQKAMDERGLSLRALARELGVAVGTAEGWLKGWRTPEIRHITNIAVFLRVDPSEVLDWELEEIATTLDRVNPRYRDTTVGRATYPSFLAAA